MHTRSDRGQATVGYVGMTFAVTAIVVTVGVAALSFVPGLGQNVGCHLARSVELVSGGAVRSCEGGAGETSGTTEFSATVVSDPVGSGTDEVTIQITAPPGSDWTVTTDTPWAQLPPPDQAGNDSDVVRVTVHANPGDPRDTTITLQNSDGQTITIPITQPGGEQDYFSVGDSYSAGPGSMYEDGKLDESERRQRDWWFDAWNEDNCFRTPSAWPRLLGNGHDTGQGTPQLSMGTSDFAACTGATVHGDNDSPSVIKQIEDNSEQLAKSDIVTISVGGNDIGFGGIVLACLTKSTDECAEAIRGGNDKISNGLADKQAAAYLALLKAAPDATIYVVGYPPVIERDDEAGGWGKIEQANVVQAAELIENLNWQTAQTVNQVLAEHPEYGSRLVFVDPAARDSPFIGHSVNDDDPYTNDLSLSSTGFAPGGHGIDLGWVTLPIDAEAAYHPNQAGNDAYADYVGGYMLGRR